MPAGVPPPAPRMPSPFSTQEAAIMHLIVMAHNEFLKLRKMHPDETREWVDGVHALQNVLGWRILRRSYPDEFPIK